MYALDIDLMRDFGARARALFSLVDMRCYTAALVGRLTQRAPYGVRLGMPLPINVTRRVAHNDSKDRALLVYVDIDALIPAIVVYTPSEDSGTSGFARISNQAGGVPPAQFVLKPSEELFARTINVVTQVTVAKAWF